MAKNVTNAEETEEIPLVDDAVLDAPVEIVEPTAAPVAAKRALGVKEPIVFKWKVVGAAQNAVVTLFKSVEREEADAQADRLQKENYYRDVRVLEASAKVVQPVQKGAKKVPAKTEAAPTPAKTNEGVKKPAKPAATAKKMPPKPVAKNAKTATKPAKKKTASTSSSKRAAKGR